MRYHARQKISGQALLTLDSMPLTGTTPAAAATIAATTTTTADRSSLFAFR